MRSSALRFSIAAALSTMLAAVLAGQQQPRRVVTYCYEDVLQFSLGEGPIQTSVPGADDVAVRFDQGRFSILRGSRTLFTFVAEDFSSNGLMLWSPDGQAFALTYSDGGAIGGFHVRVFLVQGDKVTELSTAIQPAVNDFKSRRVTIARPAEITSVQSSGSAVQSTSC